MISRKEVIETIKQVCCGDCKNEEDNFWSGNCTCEYAECCNQAISDMQKLEKIKQIIANQDELIIKIYGVAIPEGFADLFEMISQIVKEV